MDQEWILIHDDEGHWYVIPSNRETEFFKWLDCLYPEEWTGYHFETHSVGGSPSMVKFRYWRIE